MIEKHIMETQSVSFEENLKQLQNTVQQLESGELTLEQSLQTFEKGVQLTRQCQTALSQAEQKVELLLKKEDGTPSSQTFSK